MATAAASETVSLSRVSRWRKVGVRLGAVSVSVCKRLLCMFAEGWSLASVTGHPWSLGASQRISGGTCLVHGAT